MRTVLQIEIITAAGGPPIDLKKKVNEFLHQKLPEQIVDIKMYGGAWAVMIIYKDLVPDS